MDFSKHAKNSDIYGDLNYKISLNSWENVISIGLNI